MLGTLGTPELVAIFLLALLLFGPKKLPEIGRTVGKALTEFRRASNELKATFDREMKNLETETGVKEVIQQYQYDTYNYDYAHESTYEPTYEAETHDSATTPTLASASVPEGAESTVAAAPEGTIAHHAEVAGYIEPAAPHSEAVPAPHTNADPAAAPTTAEHKA